MQMKVSWFVAGLGALVALLGWYLTPDKWGYGLVGFGMAHVLLGLLDLLRGSEQVKT